MIGGHVDRILILVDASCGNFPEHMQRKKIQNETSSPLALPLLSRRFEMRAIKNGVSFPSVPEDRLMAS